MFNECDENDTYYELDSFQFVTEIFTPHERLAQESLHEQFLRVLNPCYGNVIEKRGEGSLDPAH